MADAESLTLAFVTAHPVEAARILEQLSPTDAAVLFERVPARAGTPILSAMLSSVAARILVELEPANAQALLAGIGTQAAVLILRQVSEPRRRQLVSGLPTTTAMASRLLLHYPIDSVGAWIDPDIVVFPPETTIAHALNRIRIGNEPQVDLVFLVDHKHRLAGITRLHQLLRASSDSKLARIAAKPPVVLAASATVTGITKHRGWHQFSVLPVTDRDDKLIGVLRRSALDQALTRVQQPLSTENSEFLVTMCATGYWTAFSALTHAIVSLLPRTEPISSDKS